MVRAAMSTAHYEALIESLKEISLLSSVGSVLHWDDRTQLPPRGGELRARQLALLARRGHEQFTSPRIGELLQEIEGSDLVREEFGDAAANVRETRRGYDRARRLPASLVEELTRVGVLAQQAWVEARRQSGYAAFQPWLQRTLELKRQQADCLGWIHSRYDALLEDYEPHETTAALAVVLHGLRDPLVDLVRRIGESGRQAPLHILERLYPVDAQLKLAREAAETVGFDFAAGRLDVSVHPFCSGIGPGDTRMTTRYDEHWFGDGFFGVLHETGHGLYEQGLPAEHFGTPLGEAVSLGIHESQSRLWENLVGRGAAFWRSFFPRAKAAFPAALADVSEDQWVWAVNDVRPSLIRTEADEVTYNLHILLRFELEQAMLDERLSPADLPEAWSGKMRQYLGIAPPDDARGCLQDIHWSGGAIGYFPTYTLGNLYAAQFHAQAAADLGDLEGMLSRGEFAPLLHWLREKIHRHGRRYTARQLVRRVTGRDLSPEPLLAHLRRKASWLYGI